MADNPALLSQAEKKRIMHHLGYPVTSRQATIALGIPAMGQTAFLAESQMENIPESAVGGIRTILSRLEVLEQQQFEATRRMKATELDGIKLNTNEANDLDAELRRWTQRLADDLGCPVNPYSQRFGAGGPTAMEIPIRR